MSLAIYVHTPFCPTKCGYCDFNSYALQGEIVGRTTEATIREIRSSPLKGTPAKTIFFGGGTPTFLDEAQLLSILEAVTETHPPEEGAEITSEANPGTVDASKFRAMRTAGFNRISLGAQSFLDADLIRLGRVHQSGHIERAVNAARDAGYDNLNIDLMFALPGQSPAAWSSNLDRALGLGTDHLSLYGLTLEPNTPFYKQHLRGELAMPDEEDQVDMYDLAVARTERAGFLQYEISNFSLPGKECRHNLCYWRGEHYAGYGPGAVGFLPIDGKDVRYTNMKHPERYSAAIEQGLQLWCESETVEDGLRQKERIMLGLRLNEGLPVGALPAAGLDVLLRRGWIEESGSHIRLSPAGRHFCSEATLELIP